MFTLINANCFALKGVLIIKAKRERGAVVVHFLEFQRYLAAVTAIYRDSVLKGQSVVTSTSGDVQIDQEALKCNIISDRAAAGNVLKNPY